MKHSAFIVSTLIVLMARVIHVSAQAQLDPNTTIWTQVGDHVEGAFDSVSMTSDGSVVALGSSLSGSGPGAVRLYRNLSGTWLQMGSDIWGEAAADRSGQSVSLSSDGSVVAIGAPGNDSNGVDSGHVRIYQHFGDANGDWWLSLGQDLDGKAAGDLFGWQVSLSGDGTTVAVVDHGGTTGHVGVYRLVGNTWTQLGNDIEGEQSNLSDSAGLTASLSGDGSCLVVGAPYSDANGNDSGEATLYRYISGQWLAFGTFDGEGAEERFGSSVSLNFDGNVVAIGAPNSDTGAGRSGSVKVFQHSGLITDPWIQLGDDILGELQGDGSGGDVSLNADGSVIALFGSGDTNSASTAGHVRVYQLDNGIWEKIGADIATSPHAAMTMSSNGGHVAITDIVGSGVTGGMRAYRTDQVAAGTVSVDGVVEEGGALQAVTSITDADGAVSLSYQWQRSADGTVWTTLSGASDLSYTIPSDQSLVGETLRLVVISTDPLGGTTTFTSAATLVANVDDQAQGNVNMAGVVEEGGALQAVTSITDADGAVSLSYQWQSSSDEVTWVDLVGANAASYTIPSDQSLVGEYLRLSVVSTDPFGGVNTFSSESTQVANVDDPALGSVSFDGTFEEGSVLLAVTHISDPDGSVTLSFQWQMSADGVLWNNQPAGDDTDYTVPSGQNLEGQYLRLRVLSTDSMGGVSWFNSGTAHIPAEVTSGNSSGSGGEWHPMGDDLAVGSPGDEWGKSVSLNADGSVLAIGAPYYAGDGFSSGQVRVYKNDGGAWSLFGEEIVGEGSEDKLGHSVSLSADGTKLAVGAPNAQSNGLMYNGSVRLFETIDGLWSQMGNDIEGEGYYDYMGESLSLSADGSVVAAGAPSYSSGFVAGYEESSGVWSKIGQNIEPESSEDDFGKHVSLSGDGQVLAVGVPRTWGETYGFGRVKVYRNESGAWSQLGENIQGAASGDKFGTSVALSGDGSVVAIGAPGSLSVTGSVRIFRMEGGVWTQWGADIEGASDSADYGRAVSLSTDGTIVAVGAPGFVGNTSHLGKVSIYQYDSGVWSQVGEDFSGVTPGDQFGTSLSLSGDASVLAIGAPSTRYSSNIAGYVRVYGIGQASEPAPPMVISGFTIEPNADLSNANLSEVDLSSSNLSSAQLSGGDFSGSDFRYSRLLYSNLHEANFNGANFNGSNLTGANLSGATLRNAQLANAILSGANLQDADLSEANLANVISGNIQGHPASMPEGYELHNGMIVEETLDEVPPTITLIGSASVDHRAGTRYHDAGVIVTDNVDGQVTVTTTVWREGSVISESSISGSVYLTGDVPGVYTFTYNAVDSEGNAATPVSRTVNVLDQDGPVITLYGDSPTYHEAGTAYVDPGATALDVIGENAVTMNTVGQVDVNTLGAYTLTYTASDGINTTTETRTVVVEDTTAPVVTLLGDPIVHVLVGDTFVDPGASVEDSFETGLAVTVTGSVDTSVAGAYKLVYGASDSSGNAAFGVVRMVNVVGDLTPPVVTLLGATVLEHEAGTAFNDPGAQGSDNRDGDITNLIQISGAIDVHQIGDYQLAYDLVDATGNEAQQRIRTIQVRDRLAPEIILLGEMSQAHEAGTTYVDAGSNVVDSFESGLFATVSGNVDASAIGTYMLTYRASDSSGNSATPVIRHVHVTDTIAPVIALSGGSVMSTQLGGEFLDPGSIAMDSFEGVLTTEVVGHVNTAALGTYILTYRASDSSGNVATPATRTVHVVGEGSPMITLIGDSTLSHEAGIPYVDPGATAEDEEDGPLNVTVSGGVDVNRPGTYTLIYNAMDSEGHPAAAVVRNVVINDTVAPVITLLGDTAPTIEVGGIFTDPGSIVSDSFENGLIVTVTGEVNTSIPGIYTLFYNASDSAGNAAVEAIRVVDVVDRTAPMMTLNGTALVNHQAGFSYIDAGTTVSDNVDSHVNVTVSGIVDVNTLGTYTLTYHATDRSGNAAAAVTRNVVVSDTLAPVITLHGPGEMEILINHTFVDPGSSVADHFESGLSATVTGSVDTTITGTYNLLYNVSDSSGNVAAEVTRVVEVVDHEAPVITFFGLASVDHRAGTYYHDAGAIAIDNVDTQVTVTTTVWREGSVMLESSISGSVYLTGDVPGVYTFTYNAVDSEGNAATPVSRTVNVLDQDGPVITLYGDSPTYHEAGTAYVDPGATALDVIGENAVTMNTVGQVDVNTLGAYTLTYTASDGINTTTETRTVVVEDTTAPVVTLLGDPIVHVLVGDTFVDPGASVEDSFETGLALTVAGSVNTSVAGAYELVYGANDSSGNAATPVSRTVHVMGPVSVSGRVTLFGGGQTPIAGAKVELSVDDASYETVTDKDGYYQATVTPGEASSIRVRLNADARPNQGVDVSDIVQLRKHILNREKLRSSMAWLAADTNLDNSIDVMDIVGIRKLILSRTSFYSADANGEAHDVFRFTRLHFKDVDPMQTFTELPEAVSLNYQNLSANIEEADFAAVKLGDANGDWTPPAGGATTQNAKIGWLPQAQGDTSMGFGNIWSDDNGRVHVTLNAKASQALMGLEMELSWDPTMLELEEMSSNVLTHFDAEVHSREITGAVKIAWDDPSLTGTFLDAKTPVLTYHFRRIKEGSTGLFLDQVLMAGEDGVLGHMQSASLYLSAGNLSRTGLSGAIKSIEYLEDHIELWVDTRGASAWQLESSATLEGVKWQPLQSLNGGNGWQQLLIPHTHGTRFLRLIPVAGPGI